MDKKPILSREEVLDALTVPGLNVEATLEPREVGLLCVAIIDLLEKLCGEPVAWMRDAGEDSLSAMSCCCTNGVKQLWLNVNPKRVERYTIPLYVLNWSKA